MLRFLCCGCCCARAHKSRKRIRDGSSVGALAEYSPRFLVVGAVGREGSGKRNLLCRLAGIAFFAQNTAVCGIPSFFLTDSGGMVRLWEDAVPSQQAHALLAVVDLTDPLSLDHVEACAKDLEASSTVVAVVGTKCDQAKKRRLTNRQVIDWATEWFPRGALYFETSAMGNYYLKPNTAKEIRTFLLCFSRVVATTTANTLATGEGGSMRRRRPARGGVPPEELPRIVVQYWPPRRLPLNMLLQELATALSGPNAEDYTQLTFESV